MIRSLSQWSQARWPDWHRQTVRERWGARFGRDVTSIARRYPGLAPRLAGLYTAAQNLPLPPPFDIEPEGLPDLVTEGLMPPRPEGAARSVLFLHNSYYHFLHLAAALRRRGWDAVLVNNFAPDHDAQRLFHGEDVNLHSPDPEEFRRRLDALYLLTLERFKHVHFAGMYIMSMFPENFDSMTAPGQVPWDFLGLKQHGVKIGYTISGCHDGIRRSAYKAHHDVCSKCVWELRPDVCSDDRNAIWGDKLARMCDLIAVEEDYAHEWRSGPNVYREPLTIALDPEFWDTDLEVPEEFRLAREDGELIVLHGFANADSRRQNGRDIKGTHAVMAAVERLHAEGIKVRLEHPTDLDSRDMRYLQAQADVIVDQLNLGRYGAQAREGMMLGKPTVCYINPAEPAGVERLESIGECPLASATEDSIYDVLKDLLSSPEKRREIGGKSRAFALKWHSADACAERFEQVYDRMMAGGNLNLTGARIPVHQ